MPKVNKKDLNYRLDFATMTLIVTKEFTDNAYDPGTEEYKTLCRLQNDFPKLNVVRKKHRAPKVQSINKGLTYERMERYISLYDNKEELLERFWKMREAGGFVFARKWFLKQFPNFKEVPDFTQLSPRIVSIDFNDNKEKGKETSGVPAEEKKNA